MTPTATRAARHRRTPRIAASPLPYWNRDGQVDKSRRVLEQAFADFAEIGFTAVQADIPNGMPVAEYVRWIGSYGLARPLASIRGADWPVS